MIFRMVNLIKNEIYEFYFLTEATVLATHSVWASESINVSHNSKENVKENSNYVVFLGAHHSLPRR